MPIQTVKAQRLESEEKRGGKLFEELDFIIK